MKLIERIKILIKEVSKSEREFSLQLGINPATLNLYMLGKRKLSLETIESILKVYPNISAEWLLRGNGEMNLGKESRINDVDDSLYKRIIDEQLDTIGMLKRRVAELEAKGNEESEQNVV
jgi:transcriptional regulator with XRE-family HTH domain